MATKSPRLGRGLEALLVDVSANTLSASVETMQQDTLMQQQEQLLHEAQKLQQLLVTFEQLVEQLDFFNTHNATLS